MDTKYDTRSLQNVTKKGYKIIVYVLKMKLIRIVEPENAIKETY